MTPFYAILAVIFFLLLLPLLMRTVFERLLNRISPRHPISPSPKTEAVWRRLQFFDGHNDSLLFNRSLARRRSTGHLDFPRLAQGRVGLALFAVATQVPLGANHRRNRRRTPDILTLLYLGQLSRLAFMSPLDRAAFHARRLRKMSARSGYRMVTHAAQLEPFTRLADFAADDHHGAVLLALEGAHALPEVGDLDTLYFNCHYRVLGLSHFTDNRYAGSAHGEEKYGLTPAGRELVQACNRLNMIIDLAHASEQTILDVCAMTTAPVICSHTGLSTHHNSPRNISPRAAAAIAATGGICGVGFWKDTVGGNSPDHIAAGICAFINLIGEDHVCLGSDFDGGIVTSFDVSNMGLLLIEALLKREVDEDVIEKVVWANGYRVVQAVLADKPPPHF